MKKTKPGRPELEESERKGEVFSVRVKPDEAKVIWGAINAAGKPKPEWLRDVLLRAAKKG